MRASQGHCRERELKRGWQGAGRTRASKGNNLELGTSVQKPGHLGSPATLHSGTLRDDLTSKRPFPCPSLICHCLLTTPGTT